MKTNGNRKDTVDSNPPAVGTAAIGDAPSSPATPAERRRSARGSIATLLAGGVIAGMIATPTVAQASADAAGTVTTVGTSPAAALSGGVQAFVILLREGAEAILVFAALWVALQGMAAPRRAFSALSRGALAGLLASVATAVAIIRWLSGVEEIAELVEGGALLLAAVVLLFVSSWLLGRREAAAWKEKMRAKARAALAGGSLFGLFAAGFLVIFREGAETVLFLQALTATHEGGAAVIVAGGAAALAVLAAAFVLVRRLGLAMPLAGFFTLTAWALFALAVIYAGKGAHALQEFGIIGETPLPFPPRLAFLGIYPYAETLIAQALTLLAGALLNRRAVTSAAGQPAA